jgi:hypothetical protein
VKRTKKEAAPGGRLCAFRRKPDRGLLAEAQRAEIARWCERRISTRRHHADEGVSAYRKSIEKRPQLLQLLKDADSGLLTSLSSPRPLVAAIRRDVAVAGKARKAWDSLGQ